MKTAFQNGTLGNIESVSFQDIPIVLSILYLNPFLKKQTLDSSKLKEFVDDNSKFDKNDGKCFRRAENNRKRRNRLLWAISPFSSVVSKDLLCRHEKTRACLEKG